MSACTCASLAPVAAKVARAALMRSPGGVSKTVLCVIATVDITVEPGTNTDMAAWIPNRPEKATQAMSVSFLARTGFEV